MNKNKISLNNNGFMLLETLIVSTVILGTLVFLYVQFVNVKSSYEVSFTYNTVPGIFMSKEIADFISGLGINDYTSLQNRLSDSDDGYVSIDPKGTDFTSVNDTNLYKAMVSSMNISYVLFVNDDLTNLKTYLSGNANDISDIFQPAFKKYILSLNTDNTQKNRLIVEFDDETFASVLINSADDLNESYESTYTITYELNGGVLAKNNPNTYTIYTDTFTLSNPTKTDYTFLGWTGPGYNTASTTVTIPKGSTGNRTYTANWMRIGTGSAI